MLWLTDTLKAPRGIFWFCLFVVLNRVEEVDTDYFRWIEFGCLPVKLLKCFVDVLSIKIVGHYIPLTSQRRCLCLFCIIVNSFVSPCSFMRLFISSTYTCPSHGLTLIPRNHISALLQKHSCTHTLNYMITLKQSHQTSGWAQTFTCGIVHVIAACMRTSLRKVSLFFSVCNLAGMS